MKNVMQATILSLAAYCCLNTSAIAQETPIAVPADNNPQSVDAQGIRNKEIVARGERGTLAESLTRDALKFYREGQYAQSVEKYREALVTVDTLNKDSEAYQRIKVLCNDGICRAYYHWSQQLVWQADEFGGKGKPEDLQSAIDKLNEAKKMIGDGKYAQDLHKEIERKTKEYETIRDGLQYRQDTSLTKLSPYNEAETLEKDILMKQGIVLYNERQFDLSREKFEEILRRDPYNLDAAEWSRKLNLQFLKVAQDRYKTTRTEYMAESEWAYASPLLPRGVTGNPEDITGDLQDKGKKTKSRAEENASKIIIPSINFEGKKVSEALTWLAQRSRDLDPDGVGVNFILKLTPKTVEPSEQGSDTESTPASEEEPTEGTEATTDIPTQEDETDPVVTLAMENISILEAVASICTSANLKSKIEDNAILVFSPNSALTELVRRIYPIDDGGDLPPDKEALQRYLEDRGVTFPAGSKAVFDTAISRLIITNTTENLTKIEEIMEQGKVLEPQVLIETRFVEIMQNDLNELGFNWSMTRNPQKLVWDAAAQEYVYQSVADNSNFHSNPWSYTGANGLRNVTDNGIGDLPSRAANDNFFMWHRSPNNVRVPGSDDWAHDQWNGIDANMAVKALSQSDSADVLSTPRITTMNGEAAEIRSVMETRYPDNWTEPRVLVLGVRGGTATQGDGESVATTAVVGSIPEVSEDKAVGIILSVTPHVDADRNTITLELNPIVRTIARWTDYSYDFDFNTDGEIADGERQTLVMPVFEERTIQTTIRIFDGETLILGGALRDRSYTVDDKVPVIGDLPLIGRLFQSKAQYMRKSNLLIFLNCRLVYPDGQPIRGNNQRGLPPFRQ